MDTLPLAWGDMAVLEQGGRGSTGLLLLHGTGCRAAEWGGVLQRLTAPVPVLAPDWRGHGDSATPSGPFALSDLAGDADALLDARGMERAVVVGHSLGGMAAIDLARRSDRVAALLLIEGWTSLAASNAFPGERFYGQLPPPAVAGIQDRFHLTVSRFDPAVWSAFWGSVERFDGAPALAACGVPVVAVFGGMGRGPQTLAAQRLPDRADVRWIDGGGHYLPHERPADVAAIIDEAVRTIAAV